jgi:poly-gamma-glutamate synthesis protein (capsule biosynthesis protein)
MRSADATLVNLECVVTRQGEPLPGQRFHFQAPSEAVDVLQAAGVDVFWGHSAHLFQAIEGHEGGVILCDTGDLVDDYRRDPDEHNEISFLFLVDAERGQVRRVELEPVGIDPREGWVRLADRSARSFAVSRVHELCEAFDTDLHEEGSRLVVPLEPA